MNLTKRTKVSRALFGAVAGQTTTTALDSGDVIDMQGFEGAVFDCVTGLIVTTGTATWSLWESTSTGSTGTAITGASVIATTSGSTDLQVSSIEIAKPLQRYVHVDVVTATANVTIGGALCRQSGAAKQPPSAGTAATLVGPVVSFST